ncbi:hypothetical protein B4V02_13355 [Paenibacillus kribbensis]|uniref:Uncharacterized protein n=1 Tax=Paenibacillus kribbensis TaxID=172713 RepID=A0A222WPB1_9BACL|nr:hypothetical protein B4V02_13355 [Paenibacillus kribbensis]
MLFVVMGHHLFSVGFWVKIILVYPNWLEKSQGMEITSQEKNKVIITSATLLTDVADAFFPVLLLLQV